MLIVKKFGGSSLGDAEKLHRAAENCAEEWKKGNKTLAVVSARGGSTDELEDTAHRICASPPKREMAALLSTGELQSAALMAIMLSDMGVPALSLSGEQAGILTNSRFEDADIIDIDTKAVTALLEENRLPVVCGFQGVDGDGNITTLGRGGSDTTAAALAAALRAERCEIYTDVDGVYTADPGKIPEARKISCLDYADMLALSLAGAQVLHHKCVELAWRSGTELTLLPSYNNGDGTVIKHMTQRSPFAGISSDGENISVIGTLATGEMQDRLVALLSDSGIVVKKASHGENAVKISTAEEFVPRAMRLIHAAMLQQNTL